MQRTQAREAAFKLIYERELGGDGGLDTITGMLELDPNELNPFIAEAVEGVYANLTDIDVEITKYLRGWTIKRLSKVDLSLMRLGAYEILYRDDIPDAVAINEALELSHTYSTDKAASLINGVLGSISRAHAAGEME